MASVESPQCRLSDHRFADKVFEKAVHFYVLSLDDSFFIWIGTSAPQMTNLAAGVLTKFDTSGSSSVLLGDIMDSTSAVLAQKLAKKTLKQVFVSYNLPATDSLTMPLVEKRLFAEMAQFPEKF